VYSNYKMDNVRATGAAVSTPIESGDITVSAQVSVTYFYN